MVKIKKNFVLFFTVFAILVTAVNLANVFDANKSVYAEDPITTTSTWDGYTYLDTSGTIFTTGDGTQDNPFIIDNANQFVTLKNIVNDNNYNNSSVYYKLNTNIDLDFSGFDGIGVSGTAFRANFDGNNCTISNFTYGEPDKTSSTVNVGLFNSVEGGTIKNLTIEDSSFDITLSGKTNLNCGVICGTQTNYATIENVKVISSVFAIYLGGSSFTQVSVGGITGYVYNNSQILGASCGSAIIETNLTSSLTKLQILNTGLIAGSVQSTSFVKNSYSNNYNSITISQASTKTSITKSNIGGIAGILAVNNSGIEQCFSNWTNLSLTTKSEITNNIGGIVGYIQESYIKNAYAKNNLFISAISSNNTSTNNIGGLVGSAYTTTSGDKFLSHCYAVIDTQNSDSFGGASVGATIGMLDLNNLSGTKTITNTYYVPKNSQTLTDIDYNVANGSKYTGNDIVTELNNTSAKSLSNYNGFDDSIWCNDLTEPINEGYPILIGVGNDVAPAQKQSYTINLNIYQTDENGTTYKEDTLSIEENGTATYQIELPQNYNISSADPAKGKVVCTIGANGLLTFSEATGDDTVEIMLEKSSLTVTLEVVGGVGGTIDFATGYSSKVYYGGTTSVVVTPASGYRFDFATGVALSVTGLTATKTEAGFSVANITSNLTITVTFVKVYTINLNIYQTDETGTNLIEETSVEIEENGTATYQIELPQNYNVSSADPAKGKVVCTIGANGLLTFSEATG
ncbi:MAG: hypothetical protein ACI4TT_03115, partial [Christensenellales bacterium]